jgi:FKBP-type peptidyl-prolyl cis-trans isomerase
VDAPVRIGVKPTVVVPSGQPPDDLVVTDLREGTGPEAKPGPYLTVQFVALRWNGEPFQSSWDNNKFQIFSFRLGGTPPQVNPGWEQGIPGMRVGGRRELVIPSRLLYNRQVPPALSEPDDSLIYVVELLGIDK